jgi:hypothetical protein
MRDCVARAWHFEPPPRQTKDTFDMIRRERGLNDSWTGYRGVCPSQTDHLPTKHRLLSHDFIPVNEMSRSL